MNLRNATEMDGQGRRQSYTGMAVVLTLVIGGDSHCDGHRLKF